MSRRLKIIISVLILVVIIALLIYLIYRLTSKPEVAVINGNVSETTVGGIRGLPSDEIPEVIELPELSPTKREELLTSADLERFSAMFAERYASYSNQINYANWQDLEIFMTKDLQLEIESQIAENLASDAGEVYKGSTAKALAAEVTEYDSLEGKATVLVTLQQKKAQGHSDNYQIVYQGLILNFEKGESQGWKVDSLKWR